MSGSESEFDDDGVSSVGKKNDLGVSKKIEKKSESSSRLKADCWDHFEIYETREGKRRSRCKHCSATYVCDSYFNGTTNLNKHIKFKC